MTIKEYLNDVKKTDHFQMQYLNTIGLLLLSIRNDWEDPRSVKTRAMAAICLCDMIKKQCLSRHTERDEAGQEFISEMKSVICDYIDGITEAEDLSKPFRPLLDLALDGRYFRDNFPFGYYGICPNDFGKLE